MKDIGSIWTYLNNNLRHNCLSKRTVLRTLSDSSWSCSSGMLVNDPMPKSTEQDNPCCSSVEHSEGWRSYRLCRFRMLFNGNNSEWWSSLLDSDWVRDFITEECCKQLLFAMVEFEQVCSAFRSSQCDSENDRFFLFAFLDFFCCGALDFFDVKSIFMLVISICTCSVVRTVSITIFSVASITTPSSSDRDDILRWRVCGHVNSVQSFWLRPARYLLNPSIESNSIWMMKLLSHASGRGTVLIVAESVSK